MVNLNGVYQEMRVGASFSLKWSELVSERLAMTAFKSGLGELSV